jgi:Icc-related predicted phosphoesterase
MKIVHVSDTHGHLTAIPDDADIICSSGDFMPNRTFGNWPIESAYQPMWLRDNENQIKAWLQDRPFLITHGNHDFVNCVPVLREMGINAIQLDDRRVVCQDVVFYGFPHVPYFTGCWNYETSPSELEARTQAIDIEGVDILVAHSPIYGVLDRNGSGQRCGSRPMRKFLSETKTPPKYYLSGHIHESAGKLGWSNGIQVYNSACTQQVFNV